MDFVESERFQQQRKELRKSFSSIDKDISNLKEEALPKVAFKQISRWNRKYGEVNLTEECSISVWYIRHGNSDTNEGKRGGYRIFYCKLESEQTVFLLGVYYKSNLEGVSYDKIVENLINSSRNIILSNTS